MINKLALAAVVALVASFAGFAGAKADKKAEGTDAATIPAAGTHEAGKDSKKEGTVEASTATTEGSSEKKAEGASH
jgi:hypothetical protein